MSNTYKCQTHKCEILSLFMKNKTKIGNRFFQTTYCFHWIESNLQQTLEDLWSSEWIRNGHGEPGDGRKYNTSYMEFMATTLDVHPITVNDHLMLARLHSEGKAKQQNQ
jgi:hypothetical protein